MTISWYKLDNHSSFRTVHLATSQTPLVFHINGNEFRQGAAPDISVPRNVSVHVLCLPFRWGMKALPSLCNVSPLVRRWGDNCKGMSVKKIIGDSIPPDKSWPGLGFWPTAQVSVYSAFVWGSVADQIGNMEWNSEEEKQWPSQRALESETQEGRDLFGAEGSALTPSITHLMRRHNAIVLLWENGRSLDFAVWLTSFLLLPWHLFAFFSAVFPSSCLPDALFSTATASCCGHDRLLAHPQCPPIAFGEINVIPRDYLPH